MSSFQSGPGFCDGVTRRSFLRVGGLLAGGLTLPQLLQAERDAGRSTHRSVIVVYLTGGMSHQDTFDLKPEAPDGIRGEFHPIPTSVPGIEICEHLPLIAQQMDRFAVVRSVVGLRDEHSSFHTLTGYSMGEAQRDGRPHMGSCIASGLGSTSPELPAFVDLFPTMQHRPYNSPGPGYLGPSAAGVRADGEDLASMSLRFVTPDRFQTRRSLLQQFDHKRREIDSARTRPVAVSYDRAFDVLTSSRLVKALDLSGEDPEVLARYNLGWTGHQGDGAPIYNRNLLIARRLIEAGVRCVSVAYGFWDTHGNHFAHMRQNLPVFDQGISSLVQDLHDRGLDRETTVVVWGEFGRTPKINEQAGRDHWARVNSVLMAGGGLRTGQVIGSTDKFADSVKDRAVHYRDVLATIYHSIGLDPHTMLTDVTGRPVPVLAGDCNPIRELV